MTRNAGFGRDLLVAALIISVAVHIGLMFWAKPRVMTRVVNEIARLTRKGPMTVVEMPSRPDPVKIDMLDDVQAEREAPEVAETVSVLPAPRVGVPESQPEVSKVLPSAAAIPELLTRMHTETEAPELPRLAAVEEPKVTDNPVRMPEETSVPPADSVRVALPVKAEVTVPTFEAPALASTPALAIPAESESAAPTLPVEESAEKTVFTPPAEVMAEVDEGMVEREKAAVRDLMASSSALDLARSVQVALARQTENGFTYFRVTVRPKQRLPAVPKDVVILIDASGSIGNDRLSSCRAAARRILRSCTNTGDRFNLVAFRDKFAYAFRSWQSCSAASFAASDKWLTSLAAHGRTDVFDTISSVLTLPRDPTRPLVALVVTDGDANVGVRETAQIISKFSSLNDGLVSVYMYGVKSSANRELIDVLTRGNRGESFIFDGWFRARSGEGLEALSMRFRDPVFTDLRVVFASTCPAEAYPRLLKNLYRDNSVEIVGRLPAGAEEVAFSLRGLAGATAYEGFFRLPLASAAGDASLPERWRQERAIDERLH